MLGLGLDLGVKNKQSESDSHPLIMNFEMEVGALAGDLWLGFGGAQSGLNIGAITPNPTDTGYTIEAFVRNKDTPSGFLWVTGDHLDELVGKDVYVDGVKMSNGQGWYIESGLYTAMPFNPWPDDEVLLAEGQFRAVEIK